jgi:hypothetical protein
MKGFVRSKKLQKIEGQNEKNIADRKSEKSTQNASTCSKQKETYKYLEYRSFGSVCVV